MKKLSLLVGTLGGGLAGYLFSNKKLREQLSKAKDAEAAATLLGKHLQQDGKKLARQIQDFIGSDEVQSHVKKAKMFAKKKVGTAKAELEDYVSSGTSKAKKAVKKAATKGKKKAKKVVKKVKSKAKKTVKTAARRVKTSVRKLS